MESIKVGYWLQIVANVGILAGLIIVGLQMKQAADLQRMQILREDTTAYMANELSLMGEDFHAVLAKSIESPETLTFEELRLLDTYFYAHFVYRWMGSYRLYQSGLLSELDWQREVKHDASILFGSPYAKAWWKNFEQHVILDENTLWYTEEFMDYISEQAEPIPDTWTEGYILGTLDFLKATPSLEGSDKP